jgi:hypothetical protein
LKGLALFAIACLLGYLPSTKSQINLLKNGNASDNNNSCLSKAYPGAVIPGWIFNDTALFPQYNPWSCLVLLSKLFIFLFVPSLLPFYVFKKL